MRPGLAWRNHKLLLTSDAKYDFLLHPAVKESVKSAWFTNSEKARYLTSADFSLALHGEFYYTREHDALRIASLGGSRRERGAKTQRTQRRHDVSQLFEALAPALLHAGQHLRRVGYEAYSSRFDGQLCLAIPVFKQDCGEAFKERLACAVHGIIGEDEALGFHDFGVDAFAAVVGAVRGAHYDLPWAAGADVEFATVVGEDFRPPPLEHVLGLDPCLIDEFARGVEDARDFDLALHGRVMICCLHVWLVSPLF